MGFLKTYRSQIAVRIAVSSKEKWVEQLEGIEQFEILTKFGVLSEGSALNTQLSIEV